MVDQYLIEIRLGTTKWRMNETIYAIAKKFRLGAFIEKHPHVTLFGPLILNEGVTTAQLQDAIEKVASRYDPIPFMIDGWEKRNGMHGSVIAFSVRPSEALRSLTATIAQALPPHSASLNPWDAFPEKKWFHVTIANRLEPTRAEKIFSVIARSRETLPRVDRSLDGILRPLKWALKALGIRHRKVIWPVTLDEHGLRITVMQGEEILVEYDLLDHCWIPGGSRHTSAAWQQSLSAYRKKMGFERLPAEPYSGEEIFLISDLHLGHANIIRYCSRPFLFSEVGDMDRVLIDNWNSVIGPGDRCYFLGDLRYGSHARSTGEYRAQLAGKITFIRGNHDDNGLDAVPFSSLDYRGIRFLLVHDPADGPPGFEGWTIHGHYHNNDLHHFPFINFVDRRINVSAEVIGYVPVGMDEIIDRIQVGLEGKDLRPVLLRYPVS